LFEGDDDRAAGLIEEIQKIEGPSGVQWQMAEAARLLALVERGERGQLDTAAQRLKKLDEQMPASGVLSTLRGDVARLQGDVEQALQHYQDAIDLGKPRRNCVLRMAGLLYQRGQFADVSRLIRRFEQSAGQRLDPRLAKLGAFASLQENSLLEAVRFARLGTDPNSADYRDLIELGQFQQIAARQGPAEASFRRATELVPERPDGWIALVTFLSASGRKDEAAATVTQAEAAVAPELVDYTLAQCCEVTGDAEQAAACYDRLIENFTGDPRQLKAAIGFYMRTGQREKAAQNLRSLLSDEQQEATPAVIASRRLLAVLLADSNEYADQLEALELLGANLAVTDQPVSRQDRLLKARLLAVSRLRRDQREARELFEKLSDETPLPIRDVQQLARLHRDVGEPQTAVDVAAALVARTHQNPQVLAWAIDFVLNLRQTESRLDAVQRWLELLEALRPDDLETRVLQARSLISRRLHQQALAVLTSIPGNSFGDLPDDEIRKANLRLAVATDEIAYDLDQNGRLAEAEDFAQFAEELYRQAAPDSGTSLLLAEFLVRRWRIDEAVQVCDQLQDVVPDEKLAQAYVNLLRTRRLNREQSVQIRSWLARRADARPESVPLVLSRAHAASLDGDYPAAEALYRRVIELDPHNVEALNELALLAALQRTPSSEAMDQIELAIGQAGPVGMLLDTRATIELAGRQPAEAEQSALAAIAESPSAVFYFHLAQAQLALGKRAPAKDSLRKAFQRGLHMNNVHPLERPALEQLQAELGQ